MLQVNGARVRQIRERVLDMSREDLSLKAARLGLRLLPQTIRQVEVGRVRNKKTTKMMVQANTLYALAQALGVTMESLMDYVPDEVAS